MIESPGNPPATAGATAGCESASTARVDILMVDDQPARLLTYEAVLADLEINCVKALSGEEALAKLLQQEFAVILLDVNMPGMDGFEVARLIRGHPRLETTPIIFVTALHGNPVDQLRGYEVGAIDYISVPIVPEVLRSKVAILIELYRRRTELKELNRALALARDELVEKQAQALAESEQQLAALFEHPSDAIVVLQAVHAAGDVHDWIYRNANRNAQKLHRRPLDQLVGRSLKDVLSPERARRAIELCTRVHETREQTRYETRYGDAHYLVTMFPVGRDCVIAAAADITDRKNADAALRESERRYRALIEDAPIAVAHNALDGRFKYANAAFCELVGYSREELYSRTWQQITHPEDVAEDQSYANRVVRGELAGYTIEKRYIRKDGTVVWVKLFGNFVADDSGAAKEGVAAVIDITERRKAEQALRESEQRLILAKRAARLGTHDYDIRTGNIEWDERTRELWGLRPDEPVTYEVFLAGVHPDDRASTQAAVASALNPAGEGRFLASYRVVNRLDGVTRWIEASGQAFFEHDLPVRLVGTVRDISERTIADAKLRESDRRKDYFLAMLAHELRNPVAPITSAAEALARSVGDERARQLTSIVRRQAHNLSRLLDDLLDVARITQGRIQLQMEAVALEACIAVALETVEPLMKDKRHQLTIDHSREALYVNADRVRLAQCISNLLANAAKYTNAGGRIRVQAFVEGAHAVVEVSDNGQGISPEFLPHVFELFAQSERALDRSQGGLGIGLSVCKQLIEMQGGSVQARSSGVGQGATFTLRLPLARQAPNDPQKRDPIAESRRVLIVDDNQDAADSLAMLLRFEGHHVEIAYSAEKALELLGRFDPQVALLDIGLPGMDGYELARRIRKAGFEELHLIALSGYGQREDRARSQEAGFDAHLIKPIEVEILKAVLASGRAVGARDMRQGELPI